MKSIPSFRIAFVALLAAVFLPVFAESGTLVIAMSGCKSDKGKMMVAVYDSKAAFSKLELARATAMVTVTGGKAQVEIPDLEPGTYSVTVYHDENGNGKLDTNFLGMPKEVYGFSNDARGKAGPPEWEATTFAFEGGTKTISITLK